MGETLIDRLISMLRELTATSGRHMLLGLDDRSGLVMVQEVRGEQIHTILGPVPRSVAEGWLEGALWGLGRDVYAKPQPETEEDPCSARS